MMNCVLQTMDFVFITRNLVLKMMNLPQIAALVKLQRQIGAVRLELQVRLRLICYCFTTFLRLIFTVLRLFCG